MNKLELRPRLKKTFSFQAKESKVIHQIRKKLQREPIITISYFLIFLPIRNYNVCLDYAGLKNAITSVNYIRSY